MHLTRDSLRWLSSSLHLLYSADQVAEVIDAGRSIFHRHLGVSTSGVEEITLDGSTYRVHGAHLESALPPDLAVCVHDHPALTTIASGSRPSFYHLAQHTSFSRWEETDQYQGIAKPMGWRDQIGGFHYGTRSVTCWGLWRNKRFSADEARLIGLIQSHFGAIWLRSRTGSDDTVERESVWIDLPEDEALQPCRLTAHMRRLFQAYFPHHKGPGIPDPIVRWQSRFRASLLSLESAGAMGVYSVDSARGRLFVRFYAGSATKPARLRLVEHASHPDVFQLRRQGLTARECEVLHWIMAGKRDSEIGLILGCASSTASKHVERILQKLHVETRTAAVSTAHHWLHAQPSH